MTKEAEVGDRFKGKVVKTTTFGAFVEIVKGTDGLLHISNVKPGERVETVDDVLSQGDEIDVTVVEVDRERGRIGLRLSEDPTSRARTPRSSPRSAPATRARAVATAAAGGDRGGRGGRDRGGRGGRDGGRGGERGAGVAASRTRPNGGRHRQPLPEGVELTELDGGVRVVTEAMPSVRSVALGLWVRTGSRDEQPEQAGCLALPRAPALQGHRALLGDRDLRGLRRPGRVDQRRDEQGVDSPLRALPRRAHRPRLRPARGDAPRARPTRRSTPSARSCSRRSRCTRTSPRTASTTCSPTPSSASIPLGRRVIG